MVEGVIAVDGEQRVLFANERAAQFLEFEAETAVGRKLWQVLRQRPVQEVMRKALTTSQPHFEQLVWNGPTVRNLTVYAAPLPGTPIRGAVLVLHDTTELRRLERLRQEFVANVSHELKTPLSVIKACVETLLDGAVDDPAHCKTFLQQIADQSDHLHALIIDLLSLARIETGEEAYDFQHVPLVPLIIDCLERHRARAEAKGLVLQGDEALSLSPCLPGSLSGQVTAWVDEDAVRQILDNLVDNAVKYTPAGGKIAVGCREENGQGCLEVQDTGIGIPEQDLPHIFERFYRVDKARSRELGGTGLGLSIVKHLVGALHGSISASSEVGKGSKFLVRLPRAP